MNNLLEINPERPAKPVSRGERGRQGQARRCLPKVATDGSIRGRARGCCRSTVKVALTDAMHHALRPNEARPSREGEDAASPAYFLLHLPRTGGNTIAAHL